MCFYFVNYYDMDVITQAFYFLTSKILMTTLVEKTDIFNPTKDKMQAKKYFFYIRVRLFFICIIFFSVNFSLSIGIGCFWLWDVIFIILN